MLCVNIFLLVEMVSAYIAIIYRIITGCLLNLGRL